MLLKRTANSFAGFLYRTAMMLFFWWILTEGIAGSLLAGLPFAAAAAAVWCFLNIRFPVRIRALSLFFIFFMWQSLQAGIDVALRVMRPGLPIEPAIITIPLRLPAGPSRVFLSGTLNLMPGTLTVNIAGNSLEVHVLDETGDVLDRARLIENRVAAVFGHVIT